MEETLCAAVAAGKLGILAAGKLGTLAAALTKTKLAFTVFASTDEALTTASEAPGVTAEELLAREDLAGTAKYHVIPVA